MKKLQFIEITPEEHQDAILEGVDKRLQEFRKHFQPKEPETYLTRKQVCEILHVDQSTLHNWKHKGRLKPVGIGKRVLYRRSDIEKALVQL